jgi:hypothetical protein
MVLVLAAPTQAICQDTTPISKHHKISILPVPAFGYAPETNAYVGAVCMVAARLTADTLTRMSNAKVEFNYSQRKQIIFETGWNIFTPHERFFSSGKIHFSKYPDNYWNQNYKNDTGSLQLYTSLRSLGDFTFLGKISANGQWFVGPSFRYTFYRNVQFLKTFADSTFTHFAGSYSPLGICVLQDTRNNLLNTTKGHYFQFIAHYMRYNLNRYGYTKVVLDGRKYFEFKKAVFALKWKNAFSSGPPLDAAVFGGDETARGFYLGRYRPWGYSSLQFETRLKIFRRWGMALFCGANYLQMSKSTDNNNLNYLKLNTGAGLRFLIDRKENINLRLDYAIGSSHNSGFYVAFGEAF